ncbi:hypothetical protein [Kitasatospora sp. NPDC088779]|uniref:hypothetical protein n=1 Tax=unclassified Kitasatospora TaxID=2633591 RepID=UPI0034152485
MGTGTVARHVADRLAEAGFTIGTPAGTDGTLPPSDSSHVLVTAFSAMEPSQHLFEETRRVLAAMPPGSWWLDMTCRPPTADDDDLRASSADTARVTRLPVPVTEIRGLLVASPPAVLDLRSREVCDAVLTAADLVIIPAHTAAVPIASLELGLAEPPTRPHGL